MFAYLRYNDSHPPLDYCCASARAGRDDFLLRFPSLVFSAARSPLRVVDARAQLVRRDRDRLLAVSTFQLVYGGEAACTRSSSSSGGGACSASVGWSEARRLPPLAGAVLTSCCSIMLPGPRGRAVVLLGSAATGGMAVARLMCVLGTWFVAWGPAFLHQSHSTRSAASPADVGGAVRQRGREHGQLHRRRHARRRGGRHPRRGDAGAPHVDPRPSLADARCTPIVLVGMSAYSHSSDRT